MANYYGASKTNYFRVTDEEKYQELFNNLVAEDEIEDWTVCINGETYHAFGAFDGISYLDPETEEYDLDLFLQEIQKILPEDEAFVYFESGHEKLRYVGGYVCIVTKEEIKDENLESWAKKQAKSMLPLDYHIVMHPSEIPEEIELD